MLVCVVLVLWSCMFEYVCVSVCVYHYDHMCVYMFMFADACYGLWCMWVVVYVCVTLHVCGCVWGCGYGVCVCCECGRVCIGGCDCVCVCVRVSV